MKNCVYFNVNFDRTGIFGFEAEKQENKGKIDVEVEFASPSCYFNSGRS